jgi:hypothetical protein
MLASFANYCSPEHSYHYVIISLCFITLEKAFVFINVHTCIFVSLLKRFSSSLCTHNPKCKSHDILFHVT